MTDRDYEVYKECLALVQDKEPDMWVDRDDRSLRFTAIYFSNKEIRGRLINKGERVSAKTITKAFKRLQEDGVVRRKTPGNFAWFLTAKGAGPLRMAEELSK